MSNLLESLIAKVDKLNSIVNQILYKAKKTEELEVASLPLDDDNLVRITQNGISKQTTISQIKGINSGDPNVQTDWNEIDNLSDAYILNKPTNLSDFNNDLNIDAFDGKGWTSGSYDENSGVVIFTSDDGLGFQTGDLRGAEGPAGPQGIQGIQGPQGPQGATGPQGVAGVDGQDGSGVAIQGSDTLSNILLLTGSQGDMWITTTSGTDDFSNPVSIGDGLVWQGTGWLTVGPIRGPIGPQGVAGPTGPQGPEGPQGIQGLTGPAGPQGIQGPVGPTGATGATGPQGIQGAQGPAGQDGADGLGVPLGGTTNQVLVKASNTDYDSEWVDANFGSGVSNQYNQNNITFTNTSGDYFGTEASPRTGTLTFDNTGAVRGGIAACYYNNATLDMPTTMFTLGTFKANQLNKLYFERDGEGNVVCNIINDIQTNFVKSDTVQAGGGQQLQNIVECTQAQYNAIGTKDQNTWYFING